MREEVSRMVEADVIESAVTKYHRYCRENGYAYQQPCKYRSTFTGRKVILENANGLLAEYKYKGGRLYLQK